MFVICLVTLREFQRFTTYFCNPFCLSKPNVFGIFRLISVDCIVIIWGLMVMLLKSLQKASPKLFYVMISYVILKKSLDNLRKTNWPESLDVSQDDICKYYSTP